MKMIARIATTMLAGVLGLLPLGCNTHHEIVIKQDKPMDININFSGHIDVVIQDARKDLEQITGEKPTRQVRPEDIGLPPSATGPGAMGPMEGTAVVMLASFSAAPEVRPLATQEDLKKSMAGRAKAVLTLWHGGLVGEAHTGYLVARGALTPAQQATVTAENADRAALYKLQAAEKRSTEAEVGLAYFMGRLGYAKAGDWYEKFNKQTKAWEWAQWPQ